MATKNAPLPSAAYEIDEMLGGTEVDLDTALENLPIGGQEAELEVDLQTLNLDNVVEMDFRLLTDGAWYDAVIVSAVAQRSKGSGRPQIEFIFQVDDGTELSGVTVTDYASVDPTNAKALFKIKGIAKRTGLLSDNGIMLTSNPKDFLGRRLKFQNRVDAEYDPKQPRNKVAAVDYPTTPNAAFTPKK